MQIVAKPQSKIEFSNDRRICLAGKSSVLVRYWPTGNQVRVMYPKSKQAGIPLAGKTRLVFWSKLHNGGIDAWAGLSPVITLYESPKKYAVLQAGRWTRANWPHGEREEWGELDVPQHSVVSSAGLDVALRRTASRHAELPHDRVRPAGSAELIRLWIDAMGIR